jgi:hypothetical protein
VKERKADGTAKGIGATVRELVKFYTEEAKENGIEPETVNFGAATRSIKATLKSVSPEDIKAGIRGVLKEPWYRQTGNNGFFTCFSLKSALRFRKKETESYGCAKEI